MHEAKLSTGRNKVGSMFIVLRVHSLTGNIERNVTQISFSPQHNSREHNACERVGWL